MVAVIERKRQAVQQDQRLELTTGVYYSCRSIPRLKVISGPGEVDYTKNKLLMYWAIFLVNILKNFINI